MKTTESLEQSRQQKNDVERTRIERILYPDVDIVETAEGFTVFADMPRVDEKSVEINLEGGVLTMRGTRDDPEFQDMRPALRECGAGVYERSFTVTDGIDHDKITATVKNGVLKIILPRAESEKPRKINVKAG